MNVIVIGAGIIGMFVSYYLTRDGHTVTLVDGSSTVEKTSIYNGGLITPSSVPAPSFSLMRIVSASIRQVGPIYISPRQFLKNMKWFLPVLREGTEGLGEVMLDLGVRSLELYQDFFRQESIDADLTKGMLTLYGNAEHAEEAARTLKGRFINRSEIYGVGFRDFEGGVLFEGELSINPAKLHSELRRRLAEMGVRIVLEDARLWGSQPSAHLTLANGAEPVGDAFVITAGARTSEMCRPLGYDPHIIPARGLAMIFDTGGTRVTERPAIFEDYGIVAVQHSPTCFRLSSFFDIVGFRDNIRESRKRWLLDVAREHLANYNSLIFVEEGVGYRPCTPDHLPLMGRVPGYDNLYIASGHCRLGVTLAPVTGHIMSSLISGKRFSNVKLESFDPSRFKN